MPLRIGYWAAVTAALAAIAVGSVIAVRGQATSGPAATVEGYFAALRRGDAPAALGYGPLPPGPHTLLTSTVLGQQQRIAPISRVRVTAVARHGDAAVVSVGYQLGFAAGSQHVTDRVPVQRHGGTWRLTATAVRVRLRPAAAADRATLAGAAVPSGAVLLFPGAVPIRFDTPDLQLQPASSTVELSRAGLLEPAAQLAPAGRDAVRAAVGTALRACLSGRAADPRCPVPSDRYVPGSLHGTFGRSALDRATLTLTDDPRGVVRVSVPRVRVSGRYALLDFHNRPVQRAGSVSVPVRASVLLATLATLRWGLP